MASVVINGDTSGSVTLSAPAVAGTVTVTLPAASGTMATTAGLSSYATLATPSFTTTIGVGAATASASGSGITFPASQSASTDANTLDDYEEGTWTPVISGLSSAGTGTYSQNTGTYTKIGRQVTVGFYISWSAHTGTGDISISSLPFTCASGLQNQNSGSILTNAISYQSGASAQAVTERNEAYLTIFTMGDGINWDHVNIDASGAVLGSVTYST